MCQPTASLRPLSQKSYDGEEAEEGFTHVVSTGGSTGRHHRAAQPSGAT